MLERFSSCYPLFNSCLLNRTPFELSTYLKRATPTMQATAHHRVHCPARQATAETEPAKEMYFPQNTFLALEARKPKITFNEFKKEPLLAVNRDDRYGTLESYAMIHHKDGLSLAFNSQGDIIRNYITDCWGRMLLPWLFEDSS